MAEIRAPTPGDPRPTEFDEESGETIRLVSLTSPSAEGAETQSRNAGLTDLFEERYSVEGIKKFKPHPDTYHSFAPTKAGCFWPSFWICSRDKSSAGQWPRG